MVTAEFGHEPYLWLDMVPEEERVFVLKQAEGILSGEVVHVVEHRIVRKDGTVRWVRNTPVPHYDADGRLTSYDGLVRDITERKAAEDELARNNRLLQTFLNHLPDPATVKDIAGRIVLSNVAYQRLLGVGSLDDVVGRTVFTFFPRALAQQFHDAEQKVLRSGEALRNCPEIIQDADGVARSFLTTRVPVRDTGGKVAGLVQIGRDITERLREEEARRHLEAQVQQTQKMESLGVLAGGIAHDFNNLLTSILGNLDLVSEELPNGFPMRAQLGAIEGAAKRAADLCRQMLAYAGCGRFVVEAMGLNKLIEDIGQLLRVSVAAKATLAYELDEGLPAIEGDASQIRQIIVNVVTNASEAMGDRPGAITVRTRHVEADRLLLDQCYAADEVPEGMYVLLEVADTGRGMSEETLTKLFEPFFSTKFTGRGLGLAAVLGIVRGHHGAVRVSSQPGLGTVFQVFFPASEETVFEHAPGVLGTGSHTGDNASDMTVKSEPLSPAGDWVLLVDDEEAIRMVGERMLERAGLSVLTACDGCDALDVFRAHKSEIGCVVLDLTMPKMDGEEAYRELRALRTDLPIIISSGYTEEEIRARFDIVSGATAFIHKPYQHKALTELVRVMLGGE